MMVTLDYDAIMEDISPTNEMTEQEYLQTCTTEQLAEFLACVEARKDADYDEETKAWAAWLKQPHGGES